MKKNTKFSHIMFGTFLASLLFAGYSCTKEDKYDLNSSAALSATGFNFETKSDVNVNLQFKDFQGNSAKGIYVRIYSENPYDEVTANLKPGLTPVVKGQADASGTFSVPLSIPINTGKAYIYIEDANYSQVLTVLKTDKSFSKTLYPCGYGVRQASKLRSYPTNYTPVLYPKSTTILPTAANLWTLGSFEATYGLPSFTETSEPIASGTVTKLTSQLPETVNNSAFASGDAQSNIEVTSACHIWLTFIKEGGAYNNTVGYFWYPTGSAPTSASQITNRVVVFPNSSALPQTGSNNSSSAFSGGGSLSNGTKVTLMYQNPTTHAWSDVFPAGVTVGWFLVTNGFMGSAVYPGPDNSRDARTNAFVNKNQYSLKALNGGGLSQNVIFFDASYATTGVGGQSVTGIIFLGFEDTSRAELRAAPSTMWSDSDMNDALFAITADPITGIKTDILNPLDPGDRDGDGVPNALDDYPDDPARAYDNFYPNRDSVGTLAFEDKWPAQGDYDFNDLVVDYRIKYVTAGPNGPGGISNNGKVKDVEIYTKTQAVGASYPNGFAWQLTADQSNVASITTTYGGPGTLLTGLFPLAANHYESGITPSSSLVIPFFDNAYTLFGTSYVAGGFINTVTVSHPGVELTKKVTFTTPVSVASLGSVPYNPFLVVNQDRGREVHKASLRATSKANVSYFGTADDKTDQNLLWYVGTQNYPWVLDLVNKFSYPIEKARIETAYTKFSSWVESQGVSNTNWNSNASDRVTRNVKVR